MSFLRRAELQAKLEAGASILDARFATPAPMQRMAALEDADRQRVIDELGDEAAKSRLVRFTISTENRADDGHIIQSDGWELDDYRKNPVVLWNHQLYGYSPRLADSVVWVDDKRLMSVASFFPRDISELSYSLGEIAALRGHAASVRWNALEAERVTDEVILDEWPWALNLIRVKLIEWSLVLVPGDVDAFAEARASDIPTQAVADFAAQLLDEGSPARGFLERLFAAAREDAAPVVSAPSASPIVETVDWHKAIAGALG